MDKKLFGWLLVIAFMSIAIILVVQLVTKVDAGVESLRPGSIVVSTLEGEDGIYLSLVYHNLKKIQGEDILVRVWKSGGAWEDHVFSGEVEAFDELTLLLPEDGIGYDVYYKGGEPIANG